MPSRWETLKVDGDDMRCYLSLPAGPGPYPAVVVIQAAGGVDDTILSFNERLSNEGYACMAPDLYHREDPNMAGDDFGTRMNRLLDVQVVKDVNTAKDYLKGLSAVQQERIGITGFCMGGRVVYLKAVHDPELKAGAIFYGTPINASWGEGPSPFAQSAKITCPLLGLFGEEDTSPSPVHVQRMEDELTRLNKVHEFHSYAGAGHGFMSEGGPSYQEDAAKDAWLKTVAWFDKYLKH